MGRKEPGPCQLGGSPCFPGKYAGDPAVASRSPYNQSGSAEPRLFKTYMPSEPLLTVRTRQPCYLTYRGTHAVKTLLNSIHRVYRAGRYCDKHTRSDGKNHRFFYSKLVLVEKQAGVMPAALVGSLSPGLTVTEAVMAQKGLVVRVGKTGSSQAGSSARSAPLSHHLDHHHLSYVTSPNHQNYVIIEYHVTGSPEKERHRIPT